MKIRNVQDLRSLIRAQSTIRATARAAGWKSHTALVMILTGERSPTMTPARAVRIARHLNVTLDDLFVIESSNDHGRIDQDREPAA